MFTNDNSAMDIPHGMSSVRTFSFNGAMDTYGPYFDVMYFCRDKNLIK